jgi:hypothetical protein
MEVVALTTLEQKPPLERPGIFADDPEQMISLFKVQ